MSFKLKNVHNIGLKWKLLIPFLFLPVALILLIVMLWISSQQEILGEQEEARMHQNLVSFQQMLDRRLTLAGAVAELVALNPDTQEALANRNRDELIRLYEPVFLRLKRLPGIKQFHFHLNPPQSFLRLHSINQYGDNLGHYRHTINKAHQTGDVVTGLESGVTGFSLRGVAPVYYQGRDVGSVEIGTNLGHAFLNRLKSDFGCDIAIYLPDEKNPSGFEILDSTSDQRNYLAPSVYRRTISSGRPQYSNVTRNSDQLAVIVGVVRGFEDTMTALVELSMDRTNTLALIRRNTILIIGFGLGILALALFFVLLVSNRFLAPIRGLVEQASRITAGEMIPRIEVKNKDEFWTLAQALNKMLAGLDESRRQVQNYARELERRVEQRTAELVRSEEKFRTLVENIPIVVYRLENNLISSFVSNHLEKITGWPPEEMVGEMEVWSKLIHPRDVDRVTSAKRISIQRALVFDMEYRLRDRAGQDVNVLDHAEPVVDERTGRVMYLEGYLLDIRERKHLEEQTLKAEELRTLSEISARLAHEFRNPLSVVGLSSRRLNKVLPEDHAGIKYTNIITQQVGRLEQILNMIQTFIRPMGLRPQPTEAWEFLDRACRQFQTYLLPREIDLQADVKPDLPHLSLDRELMLRALSNLVKNAAFQMPPRGVLRLIAAPDGKAVEIKLIYPAGYLPDDQLRHFFFPFTTEDADASIVDLPLVPVIIHKHNGTINVDRLGTDLVSVTIHLPEANSWLNGEKANLKTGKAVVKK